jgi:hypothetical protein
LIGASVYFAPPHVGRADGVERGLLDVQEGL